LESLIGNAELRERYGRAGAAAMIARGMTEEQMVARYIELYESILGA
jgi:hypothetical protein